MTTAADAARPKAFHLRDLTVRFAEVIALDGIAISIGEGEHVGFVGPSGAGKTTLLRVLTASQQPDKGQLTVLGRHLDKLTGRSLRFLRSEIGFIPQRFHLIPGLRVLQNVLMGKLGQQSFCGSARSLLFPSQTEQVAVHRLLDRVGIAEKLFAKTDTLSGGQQQRVAIARALYQSPKALLADEPVASVDPSRAKATMELLTTLAAEGDLTLGVSLHDRELARAFLPRLIGVRQGKILKDAPTDDWSEEDFTELYHLSQAQLLQDGIPI